MRKLLGGIALVALSGGLLLPGHTPLPAHAAFPGLTSPTISGFVSCGATVQHVYTNGGQAVPLNEACGRVAVQAVPYSTVGCPAGFTYYDAPIPVGTGFPFVSYAATALPAPDAVAGSFPGASNAGLENYQFSNVSTPLSALGTGTYQCVSISVSWSAWIGGIYYLVSATPHPQINSTRIKMITVPGCAAFAAIPADSLLYPADFNFSNLPPLNCGVLSGITVP